MNDYCAIMVEAGFLIPEPAPERGKGPLDVFRSRPMSKTAVVYARDTSFTPSYSDYKRPSGFFLPFGIFAGLDANGQCMPFTPGHSLFIGTVSGNEVGTVSVALDRISLSLPGVNGRDAGRAVYSAGPRGPVSLDPAAGGRIGYVVHAEPEGGRARVQLCKHTEKLPDFNLGLDVKRIAEKETMTIRRPNAKRK